MLIWKILSVLTVASAFKINNVEEMEKLAPTISKKMHPNTTLVLFGIRHGNKHPNQYIKEHPNPAENFDDAEKELTPFGKLSAYNEGKELRQYIGNLVGQVYNKNEAKFYSSSAVACQLTLQIVLAGLYPPKDMNKSWIKDAEWVPIPYTISDPMLRMFALKNCPRAEEAWAPIWNETVTEMAHYLDERKDVLDYIANKTGWRPSIADGTELARNIIAMKLYKTKLPEWIEHPTLPNYDKKRFIEEILNFDQISLEQCALHEPCRDLMGGVWLQHIILILKNATQHDLNFKLIGYATHTEIMLALMKLLHVNIQGLTTSAGFIIEYRDYPKQLIRILIHDPNPNERYLVRQVQYIDRLEQIADKDHWIPVDKFIEQVKGKAIWDWELACGRVRCSLDEALQIVRIASETDLRNKFQVDDSGNIKKPVICSDETDALGSACEKFSGAGLCESHDATKLLYCRKTCLCQ